MEKEKADTLYNTLKLVVEGLNEKAFFGSDVKLSLGSGSYAPNGTMSIKLVFQPIEADGQIVTQELASLRARFKYMGLVENDLDRTFVLETLGEVTLAGYSSKSKKYPYIVKQLSSGKTFKIGHGSWNAIVRQAQSSR
jgi:hypothetical protein